MLVADLEYLQTVSQLDCIKGGASTYAEANANASKGFSDADALALAAGDYVRIKTNTSAMTSSREHVDYGYASAISVAFAQTGNKYSVSVDRVVDTNVSRGY
ncbi:hypothetical protein C7B76_05900 [filamentous cyanobacterium CCP2]|nr:hypothetical protein C7B76_05900 [filamentous cyanobacterium CCP2]